MLTGTRPAAAQHSTTWHVTVSDSIPGQISSFLLQDAALSDSASPALSPLLEFDAACDAACVEQRKD